MPDDPNNDGDHGPMGFPLPREIVEQMVSQHDRMHMAHDELVANIDNFFDTLSIEQLITFRRILCHDPKSAWNQYFDGMAYQVLRLGHKVNPDTGDSLDQQLAPRSSE